MKALLAVAGRELFERRLLFLAALLLGLFALAAPSLPGLGDSHPADLRGGMALGLALVASSVLALVLGSLIIARDLGERRLGFYFARPLPGWTIWGGKMLAAALLSLGAGALVLLPALLGGGKVEFLLDGGRGAGADQIAVSLKLLAPLGVLVLLVLSHAVSVMVQSRSLWLLLDGAALLLIVATLWSCAQELLVNGALDCLLWAGMGFLAAALIAGLLAGLVQVTRGRTDLHRGHRLLSLTFWGVLGLATLGCAAYTRWVLAAAPEDLVSFTRVIPSPTGSWIALQGRAAGRGRFRPMFLFDVTSGRYVRLERAIQNYWWRLPVFSADGRHAIWLQPVQEDGYDLLRVDLSRPEAGPVRTRIAYSGLPQDLVLAPDGSQVAAVRGARVRVEDLRSGRLLASVPLPEEPEYGDIRLRFLELGRVRIFQATSIREQERNRGWRLTATDLDIESSRFIPLWSFDFAGVGGEFELSLKGRYAAIWQPWFPRFKLVDLVSKRVVSFPTSEFSPGVLFQNGIAVAEKSREVKRLEKSQVTLRILALDGTERFRIKIPGRHIRLGNKPAPELLAVATSNASSLRMSGEWELWTVDLESGGVRRIGHGMPAIDAAQEPGEIGGRLVSRGGGELLLLDPATGELHTLLRGQPVQGAPR
jgi:hypothetical protein